ncbi:MAG TPA: peptidoglycan bridge formation glycyltransferase FemA/FemB family protein [Candidatus Polarisedimenticolaceae bacterium]|nr:peptidoglycan bridge formation glycyltransferase FemA/FemB family protein [Candidatus Polarisedimenticolaceae bacterium]
MLVAANPDGGNVLQSKAFGDTKSRHGWQAKHLISDGVAMLVLARRVPLLGELWYIPKGPGVKDLGQLKRILGELNQAGPFMIKIDPEIPKDSLKAGSLSGAGLVKARRNIQYNISTVVVDLTLADDDILASFKQKTRYNIRLGAKKGVTVEASATIPETITSLYEMSKTTYERAGVYVRDKQYFSDFWTLHAEQGTGQMFFANFEGKPVAGAFITYLGGSALYKDGASYRDHPELQAPYVMQWEIMRWLKARGVMEYDLHGVPPLAEIDNPSHPLAGLARFKRGFNPDITEYIGTYDLVLSGSKYQTWNRSGERLAMAYESRRNHRLFY